MQLLRPRFEKIAQGIGERLSIRSRCSHLQQ